MDKLLVFLALFTIFTSLIRFFQTYHPLRFSSRWIFIAGLLYTFIDGSRRIWFPSPFLDSSISNLLVFLVGFFAFEGPLYKRILCSASFIFLHSSLHTLSHFLFGDYAAGPELPLLLSHICLLAAVQAIRSAATLFRGRGFYLGRCFLLLNMLFSAGFLFFSTLLSNNLDTQDPSSSIFWLLSLLIVILGFFLFFDKAKESFEVSLEMTTLQEQLKAFEQFQTIYTQYLEDLKGFRHDYKNHIQTVQELLAKNDSTAIALYLGQLEGHLEAAETPLIAHSGNLALDSLINAKYTIAKRDGINLHAIMEVPQGLPFSDVDLTIIIGNLLDNALEAVRSLPEESRFIDLAIHYQMNNLIIDVKNKYSGSLASKAGGLLATTKLNKERHGIGLALVKRAAEKYDGLADFFTENQLFEAKVLLYDPTPDK